MNVGTRCSLFVNVGEHPNRQISANSGAADQRERKLQHGLDVACSTDEKNGAQDVMRLMSMVPEG